MNMENKNLLFFYGLDCPHCIEPEKAVDDLISEGFPIHKMEVWYNEDNDSLLEELDSGDGSCGGIPFFINRDTGKTICGEASYEQIKLCAEGK